jgi:hypothetical protein
MGRETKTKISRNRRVRFSRNFQGSWGTSRGTPKKILGKINCGGFAPGGAKGQTLGLRSAITGRRRRPVFGAKRAPSDCLRCISTPGPWGVPPNFGEFFKIFENLGVPKRGHFCIFFRSVDFRFKNLFRFRSGWVAPHKLLSGIH